MRVRSGFGRRWGAITAALALTASAGAAVLTTSTAAPAGATTTTVTNTADDGSDTSLRAVLEYANEGDVIELVPGATYVLDLCTTLGDVGGQISINPGELTVFAGVTINGNGATIRQTCDGWRVIHTQADLTLNDVTITGGTSTRGGGGGIRVDALIFSDGAGATDTATQLVIRNSSIVDNCTSSNGGGFKMNTDGNVTIIDSTIAGNRSDNVGGGFSHSHIGDVTMVNSTVTANSSYDHAGVDVRNGDFTAVYSDIVGNVTGEGSGDCGVAPVSVDDDAVRSATIQAANVFVNESYTFKSFGTVVADPGTADNCFATAVSSGYNFADDETCGFTAATDHQGVGLDPMLGALASNGGPTQTLLPAATSPLVDAIPTAACSGGNVLAGSTITTDQRLLVRPDVVSQQCDIGSVELQTELPVEIQPTFTG